jgi:hypothetical protein
MGDATLPRLSEEGVVLPADWAESEKGNTWLHNDDNQVLWIELAGGCWLEVEQASGSSPYWGVRVVLTDAEKTWAHVHANLGGWEVGRWNLPRPPRLSRYGTIFGDGEADDEDEDPGGTVELLVNLVVFDDESRNDANIREVKSMAGKDPSSVDRLGASIDVLFHFAAFEKAVTIADAMCRLEFVNGATPYDPGTGERY